MSCMSSTSDAASALARLNTPPPADQSAPIIQRIDSPARTREERLKDPDLRQRHADDGDTLEDGEPKQTALG